MAATNAFCRLRGRFFLSEHFEDGVKLRFFFVLLKLGVHRVPVCGLVGDLGDSGLVSMAVCRDSHHLTSSRVFCPQGDCMALWIKSASILLTSRAWLTSISCSRQSILFSAIFSCSELLILFLFPSPNASFAVLTLWLEL